MSPTMSHRTAPLAASEVLRPGNSSSRISRPRGCKACTCRPCGTPRRCSPAAGSTSRSITSTRLYRSASTRAASRPAMLAPSTIARSVSVSSIRLILAPCTGKLFRHRAVSEPPAPLPSAQLRFQRLPQGDHGARDVALDRTLADPHLAGGLRLGEPGVVAEHYRLALPAGELTQRGNDGVALQQGERAVLGARHVRGQLLQVLVDDDP